MELFDSHAHYNDERFKDNKDELIESMYKNDYITRIVCAGYNVKSSIEAVEIANKYEYVYAIVGISPNDIEEYSDDNLKVIEELAKNNSKVVAIGEIGLDYYWVKDNKEIQNELFSKQIDLANSLELPIVIHSRDASVDTIEIIKTHPVHKKGIFHCCQLNQEMVRQALELGYYISFAGSITLKKKKNAEDVVKMVPMERILIETDSPYLSPEPYRGKRNDSRNVKLVAQKVAEFKGLSLEEVAQVTYENAKKIFDINEV